MGQAGQGRTGQGKAGQDRTGQGKAGHGMAGWSRPRDMPRQDMSSMRRLSGPRKKGAISGMPRFFTHL